MTDIKISELETLDSLAQNDLFLIDDASEILLQNRSRSITVQKLKKLLAAYSAIDYWEGCFFAFSFYYEDGESFYPGAYFGSFLTRVGWGDLPTGLGDYAEINITLSEGDYELALIAILQPKQSIITLEVDGVARDSEDFYSANVQYNQEIRFGFSISETGMHQIRLRTTGTSDPDGDYGLTATYCFIRRVI